MVGGEERGGEERGGEDGGGKREEEKREEEKREGMGSLWWIGMDEARRVEGAE